MKKKMSPEDRLQSKLAWADFVRSLLDATQWTERQLGEAVGVSESCVCRWLDRNPKNGRIPSEPAKRMLSDIATKLGLVIEE